MPVTGCPGLVRAVQDGPNHEMIVEAVQQCTEARLAAPCPTCAGSSPEYAETWDDGATFHCYFCKTTFASEPRQRAERYAMQLLEATDKRDGPTPSACDARVVQRGVRVGWLKAFGAQLPQLTTLEVVQQVIMPHTERTRCRYVELPMMAAKNAVGRAQVYVSHAWGAPFADTVAAVAHAMPDDAHVWLDVFAVRQWPGSAHDRLFRHVIHDTGALLLCCSHVDAIATLQVEVVAKRRVPEAARRACAFFRTWCMAELHAALRQDRPVVVIMGNASPGSVDFVPNTAMARNLASCVDVLTSAAAVQLDCMRLLDEVDDTDGGTTTLNCQMRGLVLGAEKAMLYPALLAAGCRLPRRLQETIKPGYGWDRSPELEAHLEEMMCAAAASGNTEAVRQLLAAGVSPESHTPESVTALMAAAKGGHDGVVRILLHAGADPNVRDCTAMTALMHAANSGSLGAVKALLKAGADPTVRSKSNMSVLSHGAIGGHEKVVLLLIEAGAPLEETDDSERTALMFAASGSHALVVAELLSAGACPDTKTVRQGSTALMLAAALGHIGVLGVLLEGGADPCLKDVHGNTALGLAEAGGHQRAAGLLRARQSRIS